MNETKQKAMNGVDGTVYAISGLFLNIGISVLDKIPEIAVSIGGLGLFAYGGYKFTQMRKCGDAE
jgi:hypothetical protein